MESPVITLLGYPFRDERAAEKLLVGYILLLLSVLVVPLIGVAGYLYRIAQHVLVTGEARLPEWQPWEETFRLGLRGTLAVLTCFLPLGFPLLLAILMVLPLRSVVYSTLTEMTLLALLGWTVVMISYVLNVVLVFFLLFLVFAPVALMHVVSRGRYEALFDVQGWWSVFRASWQEFLAATVVLAGLYLVGSWVLRLVSLIACFWGPLLYTALVGYLMLLCAALYSWAYREGQERVAQHTTPASTHSVEVGA